MFDTEIREAHDKKYLKVFLRDISKIQDVRYYLSKLQSIKNVNVTDNTKKDITVYPDRTYTIEETETEVKIALSNYFSNKPLDPVFTDNEVHSISEKSYFEILDKIYNYGQNLEKYKDLYDKFDEEGFRNYFLPFLNSISKSLSATGETFNKIGKTDILIKDLDGNNVFIAECKIWHGVSELEKAINQLLDRYVTWRDEKIALIIFNKGHKNFTELVEKAYQKTLQHSNCEKFVEKRKDSSYSFVFKHPDDSQKKLSFELVLFNCI